MEVKIAQVRIVFIVLCCFSSTIYCTATLDVDSQSLASANGTNPLASSSFQGLTRWNRSNGASRRSLYRYQYKSNPIDNCWRNQNNWAHNRKALAGCAVGFGSNAVGGKYGQIYVVTNSGDDAVNPAPGTLRYGVTQLSPLWIIFARDMTITLDNELIVTSDKTIDGRGATVRIANGPCITLQFVSNVIIHGLNIYNCKPGRPGMVRSSTTHVGHRDGSDGDGISVFGSHTIWIDHNSLSNCYDGLIDVTHASTDITISNNLLTYHDKVMLLGHNDAFSADKKMRVTVAYNRFGPGCVQRMPRCRWGYFHVVNNDYVGWEMYAIGGSAAPTIRSEGNRFYASNNQDAKQVTKRDCSGGWHGWSWRSINDVFENGAYFVQSGSAAPSYDESLSVSRRFVSFMTAEAGSLNCIVGLPC